MAIQLRQKWQKQMELQANGFVLQSSTGLPACDLPTSEFDSPDDGDELGESRQAA